jgi:hypothetical protein
VPIDNLINETASSSSLNSEKFEKIDTVILKFDIGRIACQVEQKLENFF